MYDRKEDERTEPVRRTAELDVAAGPGPWIDITEENYPVLFETLDDISHDAGFGCHPTYALSAEWESRFAAAERALAALTPEERLDFAIGEYSEREAALARGGEDLATAYDLLDDFFE